MGLGEIWDLIAMKPMINSLIALTSFLGGSFGLAIIVLTIVIRLIILPLTLKQLHSTRALQELQPKLAEFKKKYGRDKQKLAQEQMKLYREAKMNPAGCAVTLIIQFPIWIALYQAITRVLGTTPEDFLGLSQYLYSWSVSYTALPLDNQFLWLNLAVPDQFLILPILVGGSMWVQQKMVTPAVSDPAQQAQSRMMLWTMPLLFAFLTLQFPSGLALYWVVSNIISIVIQYYVTGWGALRPSAAKTGKEKKPRKPSALLKAPVETRLSEVESSGREEKSEHGQSGDQRQISGGSYPARPKTVRRNPRAGGGHRPKRR